LARAIDQGRPQIPQQGGRRGGWPSGPARSARFAA